MKNLLPLLGKYKLQISLSILFNLLTALFTLVSIPFVIPFFQILFRVDISAYSEPQSLFDLEATLNYYFSRLIAISDRSAALVFVCIILVVVVLFRNVFRYLSSFFLIPVRNGIVRDLRTELTEAYLKMPLSLYKKYKKGDLLSTSTNDIVEVEWSVIRMMELLFKSPIIIIGSLTFMFWIDIELSLISIGLMIIVGVVIGGLSKNLKKKSLASQELLGALNAQVDEVLSGIKVIKAFNVQSFFQRKYNSKNDQHYAKNNSILRRRDLASPLSEFLGVVLVIILVYHGAQRVIFSDMQPEIFFAFIFAFYNVIDPAKTLSTAYYNVQKGLASMDRIQNIIQNVDSHKMISGHNKVETNWEQIELRNISFSYDNNQIISDLSIKIEKGKSIAIVGNSGEGKSTLFDLIMRFYDVKDGTILLDGVNIKSYELNSYRSLFGYVSQEPILFEGSIIENMNLGRQIDQNVIDASLLKANTAEFLRERGDTKREEITQNGDNFSMGQRQRLAIARAIAGDHSILLIDEATTALDAKAEHHVLAAIKEAMVEKTTIIISHDFNLIKNVDIIYVMDGGKVVNSGKHDDLIHTDGIYKELLSYQNPN